MSTTHQFDPLLEPFAIKDLQLRNRVVSTSREPAYGEDGLPTERYIAYHVEKARGGIGLTVIGGSTVVSTDSAPVFGNLTAYKDEIVPWLARHADQLHGHGAATLMQLTHLGRRTSNFSGDWLPVISASSVREPAHRTIPRDLCGIIDWQVTSSCGTRSTCG